MKIENLIKQVYILDNSKELLPEETPTKDSQT